MIKFFRHIRKQLLGEGETAKYLKYAIGEILLVVLGILIALQINNWNENRKAHAMSKTYLAEIIKDLESDISEFNRQISGINKDIQLEEWALNQMNYNASQVDSLWLSFGGWYYNYKVNDRTFQKIQNAAESNLVGFDSVYQKIIDYYSVRKEYVDRHADWDEKEVSERQTYMKDLETEIEMSNKRLQDLGLGQVAESFPMRQDSMKQAELVIAFANSTRGRNHYKNNYLRHLRIKNKYQEVIEEANNLKAEIQQELEIANN